MKINVGAGGLRLDGFTNVDVRAVGADSLRGHAGDLSFAADGSVDVVFSHAVFEHVYLMQRLMVLREWKRVLAPNGVIVCIGLPDFASIASHYLAGGPGVTGETFDLFEVYRYTHGDPEHETEPGWRSFDPMKHEDSGPRGYIPQLHKGLFDAAHLSGLLRAAEIPARLLTYAYTGETQSINIGFVGGVGCDDPATAAAGLSKIGPLDRFMAMDSLQWHDLDDLSTDRTTEQVVRLEKLPAVPGWRRVARQTKSAALSARARINP